MAWVKVDDQIDQHPKVVQAGPLALALYVAGLAYCNRSLTDGFIPSSVARRLVDWQATDKAGNEWALAYVDQQGGTATVNSVSVINSLVEFGLWDRASGGYRVHDYEHYQPTRAQVQARRAGTRDRVRKHRNGVTPSVTPDVTNTEGNGDVPGTGIYTQKGESDQAPAVMMGFRPKKNALSEEQERAAALARRLNREWVRQGMPRNPDGTPKMPELEGTDATATDSD